MLSLTYGLGQRDHHLLTCGDLSDPADNALDSIHPHFQLHGSHLGDVIPLWWSGLLNGLSLAFCTERKDYSLSLITSSIYKITNNSHLWVEMRQGKLRPIWRKVNMQLDCSLFVLILFFPLLFSKQAISVYEGRYHYVVVVDSFLIAQYVLQRRRSAWARAWSGMEGNW